jgi:hypothetical protein
MVGPMMAGNTASRPTHNNETYLFAGTCKALRRVINTGCDEAQSKDNERGQVHSVCGTSQAAPVVPLAKADVTSHKVYTTDMLYNVILCVARHRAACSTVSVVGLFDGYF